MFNFWLWEDISSASCNFQANHDKNRASTFQGDRGKTLIDGIDQLRIETSNGGKRERNGHGAAGTNRQYRTGCGEFKLRYVGSHIRCKCTPRS